MASFTFIPRSVTTSQNQSSHKHRQTSELAVRPSPTTEPGSSTIPASVLNLDGKQNEENVSPKNQDLLVLIELAMSDYSLWCDPGFQRKLKHGQDGYFPLNHLLTGSSVLTSPDPPPSEADLMRCIRASPESLYDTRMLISEPSRSEWYNRGSGSSSSYYSQSGGFEIRRKDWETLLQTLTNDRWNKEWWDQRTIYVERLPSAYRSIDSIARYIHSLLRNCDKESSVSAKFPVQSVIFPSHHSASPNEPSRCKGFAFVVLESPRLVDALCQSYPWEGSSNVHNIDQEAVKFGMRMLPKTLWERFKAEYLEHQQRLLSLIAGETHYFQEDTMIEPQVPHSVSDDNNASSDTTSLQTRKENQSTWYPQNCLVFVRNVHPETNKTTLRALLDGPLSSSKEAIDYVDFNKGIDSCHLRLATPSGAAQLVSHFTTHCIAQHNPLDQVGSASTKERPRIEIEIVQGKREELYWEKVPQKVRSAAVARLVGVKDKQNPAEDENGRRHKRRKRG